MEQNPYTGIETETVPKSGSLRALRHPLPPLRTLVSEPPKPLGSYVEGKFHPRYMGTTGAVDTKRSGKQVVSTIDHHLINDKGKPKATSITAQLLTHILYTSTSPIYRGFGGIIPSRTKHWHEHGREITGEEDSLNITGKLNGLWTSLQAAPSRILAKELVAQGVKIVDCETSGMKEETRKYLRDNGVCIISYREGVLEGKWEEAASRLQGQAGLDYVFKETTRALNEGYCGIHLDNCEVAQFDELRGKYGLQGVHDLKVTYLTKLMDAQVDAAKAFASTHPEFKMSDFALHIKNNPLYSDVLANDLRYNDGRLTQYVKMAIFEHGMAKEITEAALRIVQMKRPDNSSIPVNVIVFEKTITDEKQ